MLTVPLDNSLEHDRQFVGLPLYHNPMSQERGKNGKKGEARQHN